MNIFDDLQDMMFDAVSDTMGYDAVWITAIPQKNARVLLKEPNEEYDLNGVRYSPFNYMMEYRLGEFDGLVDNVRQNEDERVSINGTEYYVRTVQAVYDGKTYRALLEKI